MAYCKRVVANKRKFDKRSFRWKKRGRVAVLVACPRGHWNNSTKQCAVGTRAQKVLVRSNGACRVGEKHVRSITSHA
jgi:hypothetical protein